MKAPLNGMRALESRQTDYVVAGLAVVAYLALAILYLPLSEQLRAVGTGVVVFSAILLVGWKFGSRIESGFSVMIVSFVAAAVLWVPTFPAMGGSSNRASIVGFVGLQAAAVLWAAVWWRGPREEPSHVTLTDALRFGFRVAVGISAAAAIPILLLLVSGDASSWTYILVFPAYFVGFLSAALLFWLLQRLDNLAVGRYVIGMLGGICLYGAVAPAAAIMDHQPFDIHEGILVSLIAGSFVGPALALNSYDVQKKRVAKRSRTKQPE